MQRDIELFQQEKDMKPSESAIVEQNGQLKVNRNVFIPKDGAQYDGDDLFNSTPANSNAEMERSVEEDDFYSDDFVIDMNIDHSVSGEERRQRNFRYQSENINLSGIDYELNNNLKPDLKMNINKFMETKTCEVNRRSEAIRKTVFDYFDFSKIGRNSYDKTWSKEDRLCGDLPFYLHEDLSKPLQGRPAQSFFVYPVNQKLTALRKKNDKLRGQLGPDPVRANVQSPATPKDGGIAATQKAGQQPPQSSISKPSLKPQLSNADQTGAVPDGKSVLDKPQSSVQSEPPKPRPSRKLSFASTVANAMKENKSAKFLANHKSKVTFASPSGRKPADKPIRGQGAGVGAFSTFDVKVDSSKPQFLAGVKPVGNNPKRQNLFPGLHLKKAKGSVPKGKPPGPGSSVVPMITVVDASKPEEVVVEEVKIEIPAPAKPKCVKLKGWWKTTKRHCKKPFRLLRRRFKESEKLTCCFFAALIILILIVCLLVIIFPIAEFFYAHKDDRKGGNTEAKR